MSLFSFSSLRTRLILLVLIAVIPALGLIVYEGVEERRHAIGEAKLEALRLTQIAEGYLDNFIEGAHHLLKALAELPEVQSRNSPAASRHFAALIKHYPYYTSIGAVDAAGNLFASSLPFTKPIINATNRAWFQRVLQTRDLGIGDFQHGGITGKPVLVLGHPALDKRGALTGMVFVSVDLSWLSQTIRQTAKKANLPPEAALMVIDRQGTILARHPDHEKWVGKALPEAASVKTILTQKEGLAEVTGIDGAQRLYAFTPIHGPVDTGLYLSAGISKKMALGPANRALLRNLVVLALVAALAFAMAGIGAERFVLRQLNLLVEASKQLGQGDLSVRSGLSHEKGEIGQLARTFDDMAQALERRAEEAIQAEKELRISLEESLQNQREITALMEGSRAVLESLEDREFQKAARSIFNTCKNLIGARAGYVALLMADGKNNEVIFLETGGLPCSADLTLPMPTRGMREVAYRTGQAVYHNDFSRSEWVQYLPPGHVGLDNALFAPLIIEKKVVGLLGLANKPGGFTENDARLASAFGELAALALHNSRTLETLEESQKTLLRERETRIRAIMDNVIDGIITIDERGTIESFNPSAEKIFGYASAEVLGQNVKMLMPEPYRSEHDEHLKNYLRTGQAKILGIGPHEKVGQRQDGSTFPLELATKEIFMGEQRLFIAVARDITLRKRTEGEINLLQAMTQAISEAKDFNSALEVALQKVCEAAGWVYGEAWVPSPDGSHLECGPVWYSSIEGLEKFKKASEKFKFPPGIGLPGRSWASKKPAWIKDVTLDENFPRAPFAREAGLKAGMAIPVLAGDEFIAVMGFFVMESQEEDERLIGFISTIAAQLGTLFQRKWAEESLRKSEARRAKAQEIAHLGNWDWHIQTNRLYWSDEIYRIFGLKPQEFGATYEAFLNAVHPDDRGLVKASVQEALDRKKPYSIEHRIVLPDGMVRFVHEQAEVYFDDSGRPLRMVGTVQDLTERKLLETQLLQSQKMEAVGTLAGGVAHDFNNLLTAMTVNLELAKAKLIKGESHEAHLEEIDNVIQRAAALTRQLLAFSRRQIIQPIPLNLNDTITNMSRMLPRLIGEHIELEMKLEGKLGLVKADPGQIEQVIMNLCVNARDAMPEGGKLILATHNINLEDDYLNMHPGVEKGQYVLLEVCDTGQGMDEATLTHIFEPFFTTKETGKGTGLGLAMVYGIIKQHEGYIDVYSEPGQGTIFRVYLPRTEKEVAVKEVKEAPAEIEGGEETILLAEDEDNLREAIRNILEMFGYTVLLAKDGQEAIEVYERDKERIDLVILDAVMPKLGGMEVAEYIYKLNPGQKILFSSGYSVEGIHEKFVIPAEMHFIQKPYRAKELAQKVREVLED